MKATDASEQFRRAQAAMEILRRASVLLGEAVHLVAGECASFQTLEALGMAASRECDRMFLGAELQELADSFGDRISVGGVEYVEHSPGTVEYHSLSGPIEVRRSTYRRVGVHNGATVVPLDLEAGLIERATPAMAKAAALGYAKHELRGVLEDLECAHRVPPSRATMERMACSIAAEANVAAPLIEKRLRRRELLPEGAHGIVLGLDRGSVPMAEERPAGKAPATRRRKRKQPYERKPPPPIDVNWRMAPVASVTITDAKGDALATRKYAATAQDGWSAILERAGADIAAALKRNPSLAVATVQDGAHELWNLSRATLDAIPAVTSYLECIDRYHVSERLGKILQIIEPDPADRKKENDRWQALLDTDADGIDEIEKVVLRANRRLTGQDVEDLSEHVTYLRNNKDRMRYRDLAQAGLPVGSGAVESACNTVLNLRTKRNAEHWSNQGLRGVLTLRGIHQSKRFDAFWMHLSKQYQSNVMPSARAA